VLAVACLSACGGASSPTSPAVAPTAAPTPRAAVTRKTGLEVGWIAREPRLAAPPDLSGPVESGWPASGSAVHWVAHVLNRSTATAAGIPYAWRIDGEIATTGTVDLPPGTTEVLLPWNWTFEPHRIGFEIAPTGGAGDTLATDNRVEIVSTALSLELWIEPGAYDWMLEDGRPGLERWAQDELVHWNAILAGAVFPTAPEGALDRIRLDAIRVVPAGYGLKSREMLEADLHWYVPESGNLDARFLQKGSLPSVLADQSIMLHELLHLRGLTDLYAYVVRDGPPPGPEGRINILENGHPVAGTTLMPYLGPGGTQGQSVYASSLNGLMGSDYRRPTALTEHCVNGLNLWARRRTPYLVDQWGNLLNLLSNRPHPEAYVARLPRLTDLYFKDETGAAITGATVDVFVDHHWETYKQTFTAEPQLSLRMDARGAATMPRSVFDGRPPTASPPKSQVVILGVRTEQARGFAFVPVHDLNLLYFRGGEDRGSLEVTVRMHRF
jgi:hypothetical protein